MGLPKSIAAQQELVDSYDKEMMKREKAASEKSSEPEEVAEKTNSTAEVLDIDGNPSNDPRHGTVEYWRQRCHVVLGKYNAESRRWVSEKESLTKQIEDLTSSISAKSEFLSAEEKEEYGEYATLLENTANKQAANTKAEIARQQQAIEEMKAERVQERANTFYDKLSSEVPDWDAINTSNEFNDWLDETDMASGLSYRELLQDAEKKMDANRAVYFFKLFGRSGKQSAPKKSESILPETRKGGDSSQTGDGWITATQIEDFYREVQQGKYRGRQKEVDAMEIKIAQASQLGKIINR